MRLEATITIDRPVSDVFRFVADEHGTNHPRWDPTVELWQETEGPVGVGTVFRRRSRRTGEAVEGTMEVVEFERDRAFGAVIREGGSETRGFSRYEPDGPGTRLTIGGEMPDLPEEVAEMIRGMVEQSAATIKRLVESET